MFSAIANYLFGADKPNLDDVKETEYRTQEDDDWLLVNVSDQKDIQDKSIANEEESAIDEEDEDDVLTALPFLWSSSTFDNPLEVSYSQDSSFLAPAKRTVSASKENSLDVVPMDTFPSKFHTFQKNRSIFLSTFCARYVDLEWIMFSRALIRRRSTVPVDKPKPKPQEDLTIAKKRKSEVLKPHKPYPTKSKQEKLDRSQLTCAFVNHQSPILITKTELLQQINDLRPVQQAKEYETKKRINKAQLNRQNKAYLYESSNKNQHRRDLWVRHSGANNNRKCS